MSQFAGIHLKVGCVFAYISHLFTIPGVFIFVWPGVWQLCTPRVLRCRLFAVRSLPWRPANENSGDPPTVTVRLRCRPRRTELQTVSGVRSEVVQGSPDETLQLPARRRRFCQLACPSLFNGPCIKERINSSPDGRGVKLVKVKFYWFGTSHEHLRPVIFLL